MRLRIFYNPGYISYTEFEWMYDVTRIVEDEDITNIYTALAKRNPNQNESVRKFKTSGIKKIEIAPQIEFENVKWDHKQPENFMQDSGKYLVAYENDDKSIMLNGYEHAAELKAMWDGNRLPGIYKFVREWSGSVHGETEMFGQETTNVTVYSQ